MSATNWIAVIAIVSAVASSWGQFWLKHHLEKRGSHLKQKPVKESIVKERRRFYFLHVLAMWVAYITLLRERNEIAYALANSKFSLSFIITVVPAVVLIAYVTWLTFGRSAKISN